MTDVQGLTELLRLLKQCDTAPKLSAVMAPHQPKVKELVERESRSRANSRQMSRAEKSNVYKANKVGVTATMGGGGGDKAWAVGAQMGAVKYRQFPRARQDGFTVIPAVKDNRDDIAQIWADAITALFP